MKKYIKLIAIFVAISFILIACSNDDEKSNTNQENNQEENQEKKENKENESSLVEMNRNMIISAVKEFVIEYEENTSIQFPEEDQHYQIDENDDEIQNIVSAFTGRLYKNVYFVEGSYSLNDEDHDFEMILSWNDPDSKQPLLLKYSTEGETKYKLEEAEIHIVENGEFIEL
ncbi:hypothetical protein [Oceanobacillus sojae]|uniref:hypothetical protein n=1 Tax=Oceanobacillus sojae TaxID=582851 RepID=UPI00098854FA|nr:hypothetical protein [Oceanobacillus sojae]MCT1905444.1 hypothetical protein [Oceanobacillus sojae]